MPIYRAVCECGAKFDQFLKADFESVVLDCHSCGRGVNARQVRDKTVTFKDKDGVIGVMRDGEPK